MASKLKTDILETVSGSGTIALTNQLSGMTSASVPSGSVLQIVSSTLKSAVAISSNETNTYVASGLAAAITPSSTSSKILVSVSMMASFGLGTMHFRIARGSDSTICIGDAGLSLQLRDTVGIRTNGTPYAIEMNAVPMQFLDSPSTTSATTYSVMITLGNNYNSTMFLNRPNNQDNGSYAPRGTSTITLTEIKG